jgi:hypothetical protein
MESGQWSIGVSRNVIVFVPVFRVSPVFTIRNFHLDEAFLPALGDEDHGIRRERHNVLDARGVVVLDMVDDDVLDLRGVGERADIVDGIVSKVVLYRVHERHVLVENKVVIVRRAVRGDVPMEVPNRPVNCAHPINAGLDLYRTHNNLLYPALSRAAKDRNSSYKSS